MKILVLVVVVAVAFWGGYDLCAYRAYGVMWPMLSRAREASNAVLMTKFVDRIDQGDIVALRAKLLPIAKVTTDNPNPPPEYSFRAALLGPLESTVDVTRSVRAVTDAELVTVRSDIARLCHASPATESYRSLCGS